MSIETTPSANTGRAGAGGATAGPPAEPAAEPPPGLPGPAASRADRFREEISDLKIKDPKAKLDAQLLRLGVLLMVVGIVLGIIGYATSHSTTNPLQQRDAVNISLIGVSVTIIGAAFFLRYSIAGFLRFWLARMLFEQQERQR